MTYRFVYSDHCWKVIDMMESIADPVTFRQHKGKKKSDRPLIDVRRPLEDLLNHPR